MLCGPQTRPVSTWCPGPVHSKMVLMMPDALRAIAGLQVRDPIYRFFDASNLLPPNWLSIFQQVQYAPDDARRMQALEDFLEPRRQRFRLSQPLDKQRCADWVTHLALRSAVLVPGRSPCQFERRIKHWSGLPLRELRVMGL